MLQIGSYQKNCASSKTKCNKRVSLSERYRRSRRVARGCLHLSERKKKQPAIQIKKETEVSQRLTNFVLQMYHQLISEQRSQIFALLQKKTARKEIADIVGISQSTLSREIKRNSTPSGKYIWTKAHDMAMQRRKSTVTNAKLSDELVWRIKEYITTDQWSPRRISGYLRMNEGIEVSHQSIYNIIHNDTTGTSPNT